MTLLIAIIVYPFIYRWLKRAVERAERLQGVTEVPPKP